MQRVLTAVWERLNQQRNQLLALIGVAWFVSVALILAYSGAPGQAENPSLTDSPSPHLVTVEPLVEPVIVTHWASSHLTRTGLLPEMAERFSQAGIRTESGRPIEVRVHNVPPALQAEFLTSLLKDKVRIDLKQATGVPISDDILDPTIVTPSSAHWFVRVNHVVGRQVVDLRAAESLVQPFIGIVTYQEMAECLGWPTQALGYEDILTLRENPEGWSSLDCGKVDWGQRPLVAYTDPTTSSTGRSLLLGLYAMAADKAPQDLTLEDVRDDEVIRKIKRFQGLIDHYSIGTTVLNTKIHQGPRSGHFFIMPEDNLIHLYEGTEQAYIGGKEVTAPPIDSRMVMIYPSDGAMPRSNCACIVNAEWVTPDHVEGAEIWIDYLLEDDQQRSFMAAGFRPGSDIPLNDASSKITERFGLNPELPSKIINPSLIDPQVAAAVDAAWEDVKKPGIVTVVVDNSSSMAGGHFREATEGVIRFLGNTAAKNQVGLITFNDSSFHQIDIAPLETNDFKIAEALRASTQGGRSPLYDAIKAGIELTDAAPGDQEAIRGVVVLTDGKTTIGDTRLHDLIVMRAPNECRVEEQGDDVTGYQMVEQCSGSILSQDQVRGTKLNLATTHRIQIFFIGIGEEANLEVGRLLAEASGAEYVGAPDEDLARVIERFGKYF